MSSRTRALVFLISTPLVVFVIVGGILGPTLASPVQRGVPHLKVFEDVASLVMSAYVEDVNVDKVFDGAMRGLADGLDASSAYLTPAEVRAMEASPADAAADVGITVIRQFYLRVVGVRDGSPAARAGVRAGDFIRAIGETPTREMSALAGARLLQGTPGSSVSLLVIRGNAADPREIQLTREVPASELVTSRRLPGGGAYVRIASFRGGTAEAIRTAIGALGSAVERGVIIDVRGTADGAPEAAIAAAKLFVKEGPVATRATRRGPPEVTSAGPSDGSFTMPTVLLVSNGTANAAEIFAAGLDGASRATLVGEPTAGIAGVQRLVKLPEGQGFWMTYARYLQADGSAIHERGLRPDVAVEVPPVGFDDAAPTTDPVLDKAVEELAKRATS
jgi:carboxyl-terminal processing protease